MTIHRQVASSPDSSTSWSTPRSAARPATTHVIHTIHSTYDDDESLSFGEILSTVMGLRWRLRPVG